MLELGDTGMAMGERRGRVGVGVGVGVGAESEEEGKVWAHTQHPNPLGVHGTGGQMRGLIWSKGERVGGVEEGSGGEGFGGGSGSGSEGERERWMGGGEGSGSASGREGEAQARDFSGVGAFI